MALIFLLIPAALLGGADATRHGAPAAAPAALYLDAAPLSRLYVRQDKGRSGINRAAVFDEGGAGAPMRIGAESYAHGIGLCANGEVQLDLDGMYRCFDAVIGVQPAEDGARQGTVRFEVLVDGKKAYESGLMTSENAAQPVSVCVEGALELRLVVRDGGDGNAGDIANWADARLTRNPKARPLPALDIAPFARVVTCDPERKDGTKAGRLDAFPASDVFLETELAPGKDGAYTVPKYAGGLGCIGLQWAERRVLKTLSLEFARTREMPPLKQVRVEYWSSQGRVDSWGEIGQTLWQGAWAPLEGQLARKGNQLVFSTASGVPEYKTLDGSQKVRWIFPVSGAVPRIRRLTAVSRSVSATGRFRVELENPAPGQQGVISIYNGYVKGARASGGSTRCSWRLEEPLSLEVQYAAFPRVPDRTVLRIELPGGAFGVAVDDVLGKGCVYVKDYGVFVTPEPQRETLTAYKQRMAGRETTLERVRAMPDQTFEHAMKVLVNPAANRDPLMLSLACGNSKFVLEQDGRLGRHPAQGLVKPVFGAGEGAKPARKLADTRVPIAVVSATDNGIAYRERVFVAPIDAAPDAALVEAMNLKAVCVAELAVENTTAARGAASLALGFSWAKDSTGNELKLDIRKAPGNAYVVERGGEVFALLKTAGSHGQPGPWTVENQTIRWSGNLLPRGTAHAVLYLPGWALLGKDAGRLLAARPEELLERTRAHWEALTASAMQITTPEPLLDDIYRASLLHCMLAARNFEGRFVEPWCGSDRYGPLDTETQAVINGMDLWGLDAFARSGLEYFLTRYNETGFLANYYTIAGTGQHLWTLGQHYFLTRDPVWLRQVSPTVEKACRWIMAERRKTMRTDPAGERMPEYGLVTPGVLADWNRYAYYFYADALYYAGLSTAARALADIGCAGSEELVKDAEAFRGDILRAYRWNQARMPVLPLNDGAWAPAYPSSVYTFGPTRDFYKGMSSVGHDVEVGGQHLVDFGVLDSGLPDKDWMTNYMEDFWFYLTGEYSIAGYTREQMATDWFTYGGFSKQQPFYVHNGETYALADDVKPFIRTYFNSFPPMLSTDTLAFWEHFNALGAPNKNHETGWFLRMTRLMFVMERQNTLWLAPFVTDNWLKDGLRVEVRNAPTDFGPVSYRLDSHVAEGYIDAEIAPPGRNPPEALVLRVRHPEGKPWRTVEVTGGECAGSDVARHTITLRASGGAIHVRVRY